MATENKIEQLSDLHGKTIKRVLSVRYGLAVKTPDMIIEFTDDSAIRIQSSMHGFVLLPCECAGDINEKGN